MHDTTCQNFLAISKEYRLGQLSTEASHPRTQELSEMSVEHLEDACELLKEVDIDALKTLSSHLAGEPFFQLKKQIAQTLNEGWRVFFVGCGSTGRLSLLLETLWRDQNPRQAHQVVSFMAGGDLALIRSVEKFEDFPHYGKKQLLDLKFKPRDLLIAVTEGGETPFVMGAALAAAQISIRHTFYIFCNPSDLLQAEVPRTRQIFKEKKIKKISLPVGPMALSGSTRMQASTALLLYLGAALLDDRSHPNRLIEYLNQENFSFLGSFIKKEEAAINNGNLITYQGCLKAGMSILSDTTERAPTFGVDPFDHLDDPNPSPSLCYFQLKNTESSKIAWEALLRRPPRTVEWPELNGIASYQRLLGFDLSSKDRRKMKYPNRIFTVFSIDFLTEDKLRLSIENQTHTISLSPLLNLEKLIFLKILLNISSTCLMGRLNRYEGNTMTWVRPSNYKLIDRSIRYADRILRRKGKIFSYEDICAELFRWKDSLQTNESIVIKIVKNME
jgi:N-acetylmuramic acid 6-phosphate etherase